jgi:hypothetical protein
MLNYGSKEWNTVNYYREMFLVIAVNDSSKQDRNATSSELYYTVAVTYLIGSFTNRLLYPARVFLYHEVYNDVL